MVRILFLFALVFVFSCTYQTFMNVTISREGVVEEIKKEKTINTVQTVRQKRHEEAERAMNAF